MPSTLLHVFAVGYMADGDEGRNSRVGLGSKPQGGMASAPVANIRMSANRSLASPSEKTRYVPYMPIVYQIYIILKRQTHCTISYSMHDVGGLKCVVDHRTILNNRLFTDAWCWRQWH